MPENLEPLQAIAQARYKQDLQGAMKRMFINNAQPTIAENDFEGMCRAAGIWPIWDQSNYNLLNFFLSTVAAP